MGQEEFVSRRSDGEPGRYGQLRQPGGDLPQVGHLAAHSVGQAGLDSIQGQHQFLDGGGLPPGQDGVDLSFNGAKDRFQGLVTVAREFIEILDHGKDLDANRGGVGADKGHAEAMAAVEGGLHVRHEL